jgi:hypothetical protein
MHLTNIQLLKILREKLGEDQAESLVTFVESKVEQEFEDKKAMFATKEDISKLETKIESSKNQVIIWTIGAMIALLGLFKILG